MRVLITGAAGFVGFHLARRLAADVERLVLCDNFSRGRSDGEFQALLAHPGVELNQLDLTQGCDGLGGGYDVAFHLAAINGTRYFYERPADVARTNLLSLINILDWVAKGGAKRLVWTSSAEIYAGAADLVALPIPTPEEVPFVVNDLFNPRFSYGASKGAGEVLCAAYSRQFGIDVCIIRPHNVYGPRMGHEHVIPEFIGRAIRRENPFVIFGPEQTRAFCYVDDCVSGLQLAGQTTLNGCDVFHIGDDREEILVRDLATRICNISGYSPTFETRDAPLGSVPRRCPSIGKAAERLRYVPRTSLSAGLSQTFAWYAEAARR